MSWQHCKKILCIRPDNMGDLIMSGPALRALKESFGATITVLTSSMAAGITSFMPEIEDVMTFDLPWVKNDQPGEPGQFNKIIDEIKERRFDAAVIFTVYSQNPLPAVMLAYLAGIPNRLAYCRENPYQLLTHWVPDEEPYTCIKHQVRRDLDLVGAVGAITDSEKLNLILPADANMPVIDMLKCKGVDLQKPWLIIHPGVSEAKREYAEDRWVAAGKKIIEELGYQVLITGGKAETTLTKRLSDEIGAGSFDLGGIFNLQGFIALIKMAPVVISVNTGTVHIAAALGVPVVVLYALTNPQHTPWQVPFKVLPFTVPEDMQSKNEVIQHVNKLLYQKPVIMPDAAAIVCAVRELIPDPAGSDDPSVNWRDPSASVVQDRIPAENRAE